MITFGLADLVLAASRALGLGTAATLDLLDVAAAEAALRESAAPAAGQDPAPAAAALLHALVLRRPFSRGNDCVALAAAVQLLALHGQRVCLDPPAATISLIRGIAAGQVDAREVRAWLAPRLSAESDARSWEAKMRNLLPARRRTRRTSGAGADVFGRFTPGARRAVVLAQEEARKLGHDYIGTEHILLGLVGEGEGVAARALAAAAIGAEAVRREVEEIIGTGLQPPSGHLPFTPRAKKVLQISRREALRLGSSHVGTEHILLGLIREGEGVAAAILDRLGVSRERVRHLVVREEAGPAAEGGGETGRREEAGPAAEGGGETGRREEAGPAAEGGGETGRAASEPAGQAGERTGQAGQGTGQAAAEAAAEPGDSLGRALRAAAAEAAGQAARAASREAAGQETAALRAEVERQRREIARLTGLLRQHGISPGDGQRSA